MHSEPRKNLDFGVQNVLLIAATVGALWYASTLYKPNSNGAQPVLGFGVDAKTLSLANPSFAAPQPSELASAIDFNNGTLKSDYVGKVYAQASQHGSVLGAATYNQELVKEFADIKVQTVPTKAGDNTAIQVYAQQLQTVMDNAHVDQLMSMAQTPALANSQKVFLSNMQAIAAPDKLADYHRLLLGYYGLVFLQRSGKGDIQTPQTISAVLAQLDLIAHGVQTGSNVTLPAVPR